MAKQGGKGPKPKTKGKKKAVKVEGDLTRVPALARALAEGDQNAAGTLTEMGRDAAFTVLEVAAELEDEELEKFGRRLAAIPATVTTNLHDLRRRSVRERLETERRSAAKAAEVEDLAIRGGALGIFDPQRVVEDLATGGRPQRSAERLQVGDIACLGLPSAEPVPITFSWAAPPPGQAVARLRLKVDSGLVFVGPPEASDGPRMGTVRLDPFRTKLDEHAERGRFLRWPNGVHAVAGFLDGHGVVRLFVAEDTAPDALLALSPMAPVSLPRG